MPQSIDRQLIMLALFYSSRDKHMMAEGLYRQVLDKLEHDKSTQAVSYNLVMALNFYGKLLVQKGNRISEAQQYLQQSEQLAQQLPFWYDKIDSIYMPDFDLD